MTPSSRAALVNLPNILTTLRLLLVPIFVVVLFQDGGNDPILRWCAGVVFTAAALTDRYDGKLARARGQVTTFGKIADPIADKALIGAALVGLSILGEVWWWITIVILVREFAITALRLVVVRRGVIAASRGGKWKTLFQIVAIGFYVLPMRDTGIPGDVLTYGLGALMTVAVLLTVLTAADYVARAAALLRPPVAAATSGATQE